MISISIDVTKIDKTRIKDFEKRDGTTAKYLELILIETPGGQYGDYMVKQSATKEERDAGKRLPILGNGKNLGGNRPADNQRRAAKSAPAQNDPPSDDPPSDDPPF